MIVVADSGPLHYLILLDHAELLQRFYGEVVIPGAVATELSSLSAPTAVRDWMSRPPSWVNVVPVEADQVQAVTDELALGERAAIALAAMLGADLLLIDEAAGRAEARRRNLRVMGTLGVLRAAAERGLVDVPDLLSRLEATGFYEALVKSILGDGSNRDGTRSDEIPDAKRLKLRARSDDAVGRHASCETSTTAERIWRLRIEHRATCRARCESVRRSKLRRNQAILAGPYFFAAGRTPVNASPASSRTPTHDSGPKWVAKPFFV